METANEDKMKSYQVKSRKGFKNWLQNHKAGEKIEITEWNYNGKCNKENRYYDSAIINYKTNKTFTYK